MVEVVASAVGVAMMAACPQQGPGGNGGDSGLDANILKVSAVVADISPQQWVLILCQVVVGMALEELRVILYESERKEI